jgi:large subunit ribosomal protein L25
MLQTLLSSVTVEALPSDLPQQIDVDVSGLTSVGDTIHARDLVLPAGVTMITDSEELVAAVVAEAAQESEDAAAADDAATSPEVEPEAQEG